MQTLSYPTMPGGLRDVPDAHATNAATATAAGRRPMCRDCRRPLSACICALAVPVANDVEVMILQHPLEQDHAKGSARLLDLSLRRSRIAVGETFDAGALHSLLHDRFAEADAACGQSADVARRPRPVLLYPDAPGGAAAHEANRWSGMPEEALAPLRLIVLDATWRKSRKMLFLNPLLQSLPRLALNDAPSSRYRIRKAHAPHQLSTLEAACHALAQLEGNPEKYRPLLDAFERFVARQSRYAGGSREGKAG